MQQVRPRKRQVAVRPAATDRPVAEQLFRCEHHRCTMMIIRCLQRQQARLRLHGRTHHYNGVGGVIPHRFVDPYCASGECEQGNANRKLVKLSFR